MSLVHHLDEAIADNIHVLAMHESYTQHDSAFERLIARGVPRSEVLVLDPQARENVRMTS